nr:type 1 glutamine amidotransferase [uncultured Bacteroides sp.]
MKINILVCDWFEDILPDFIQSFPTLFYDLFNEVETDIEYQLFDVQKGEFPKEFKKNELCLITGSRAGAYEDDPWIKKLLEFIRQADAAKAPMAGVCFGHQVIAQALGGKVEPSTKGWGTGIRVSKVVHPKGFEYFPDKEMRLHYNHNDQVVQLPPEAELIATSDFCENEAFLIGDHILSFQGHPEYSMEYAQYILDNETGTSPKIVEQAKESLQKYTPQGLQIAKWILKLRK